LAPEFVTQTQIETSSSTPSISAKATRWVLAALCVQFVALGLVQAWRDAPTYDESYHLAAGVTGLTRHQLRVTPEHPPLPGLLAALPVLAAHPVIPNGQSWRSGYSEGYARRFVVAQSRAGKLQRVTFLGRLVPLAEGVAVALLAYALAKPLFGRAAGVLAATVWLTLPLTVGLSHLNGVDVPFSLTTLVLALAVLRYVRGPSTRSAILVGTACGLGLTVSLTAFVLVLTSAAVVLVVGWRRLSRAIGHVLLISACSFAIVWFLYRLVSPFPDVRHAEPVPGGSVPLLARLARFVPWPSEYDYGIWKQALIAAKPGRAYLLGEAWEGARWWFWPGSALVKLPASALIIVLVGLICWRKLSRRTIFEGVLVLGVPALALTAFIVPQPRQLGLRYLLPVITLAVVAGSPAVRVATKAAAGRVALALILAAQLFWLWESAPRSLAWTAPPFRPGYQVAADSNLDWGQDLYRLRDWVRHHPRAVVFYFGTVDPKTVLQGSRSFSSTGGHGRAPAGWYAVSASHLTDWSSKSLAWLRAYCPVGLVGDSILLYRFRDPPNRGLRGGDEPPAVCREAFSRVVNTGGGALKGAAVGLDRHGRVGMRGPDDTRMAK
jgi:4-amino-4-deoxy-L-arabinose transferase-like glycosyltransferase